MTPDDAVTGGQPTAASRALLFLMGRAVANGKMYGPVHRLTTTAVDACYEHLAPALEATGRIDFTMVEGALLVEGKPAGKNDFLINTLSARFNEAGLTGLSLVKGLTREEFGSLFEVLIAGAPTEGAGSRQPLVERGIEHVQTFNVTYRSITEQEEVVLKSDPKPPVRRGPGGTAEGAGGDVDQVQAFLRGDALADSDKASKSLAALLLADPGKLAHIIVETAAVDTPAATPTGTAEHLANGVVTRLDQIRRALWKERSAKSLNRKAELRKKLLQMGTEILSRMGDDVPVDPGDQEAISAAIEEMVGEAGIEAIASDYAKKRASLQKAEKDFLQQIQAMGMDKAIQGNWGEKVLEEGVTASDWRMLLSKAAGGIASSPDVSREIVGLLSTLDNMIRSGSLDPHVVTGILSKVKGMIESLAGGTEEKIKSLGEQLRLFDEESAGKDEPERAARKRSMKALLELLAEILQELSQPLTVLSSVTQMLAAGYLGPVNKQQTETLGLGLESAERAKQLLETLINMVGVPKDLIPDKEMIQSAVSNPIINK